MEAAVSPLPDDAEALKALLTLALQKADAAEQRAAVVEAELANARVLASATEAMIAHLKLQNAKLRREQYGASAERTERLLAQFELGYEDLEVDAAEDELAAEFAAAKTTSISAFERKKPVRKPFPEHLPRERVVVSAPCSCPACGSDRLSRLGEDVTETLEVIPRAWKVIQTVREKFACRACEKITQPPAPFHVTPRGWAGPSFLAMLMFDKYGQHQPLHRQAERFACEGVPLSVSTLADQIGAACHALMPIYRMIEAHVLAAERIHGDDTTVPVMAKGKTDTGRLWDYVRDDRPFGGSDPPAVIFHYSRDRRGEHPRSHLASWSGSCKRMPMAATEICMLPIVNRANPGSRVLRARPPEVLRACRRRGRGTQEEPRREGAGHLPDRAGGRAEARRPVRDRARHQRQEPRRAARQPPGVERAADGGTARVAERATRQNLPQP
jgi:transposase